LEFMLKRILQLQLNQDMRHFNDKQHSKVYRIAYKIIIKCIHANNMDHGGNNDI